MPGNQLAYDIIARDRASKVFDKVGRSAEGAGKKSHKFGLAAKLGSGLAAGGLGALAVQSIKSAASFETTMRQIAVATNAPAESVKGLSKLALKMGQDTVFSAQDAGAAMLELAKSGMTEADIRAGALAQTLTLASAGGLELGNAAGYITSGLALFSLGAEKSADVAAALAGAANASKASVEDMGLALSQVGPGAAQAGLSLQETTGILALFAKNGILGSDAGTSLKTMLARLVPTTDKAQASMEALGLKFTDANGAMLPMANVAEQLRKKLGKLSDAQRITALNTLFGSDASRAAAILMKEGRKGVEAMTRATSDKTQADKLAKAATEGTAGALSQLEGSIDTAKLALGTALAPLVVQIAGHLTSFANTLGTDVIPALGRFIDGMEKGTGPGGALADTVGELGDAAQSAWRVAKPFFTFIGDHPKLFAEVAKDAALFAVAMKGISTVKKLPGLGSLLGGGGKGGVLGGISKAAPLPVLVTNPGFGVGGVPAGGGKGAPVPVGVGGTVAKEGRFGKILASNLTAQAVLLGDVVLGTKAASGLKDTIFPLRFNLSVNDAAQEFLAKVNSASTDNATRAILQRHFNDVWAGVAEAAKTGNTKLLQQALLDTDADLQAHDKQILKERAKDGKKLENLLTGGLSKTKLYADAAGKSLTTAFGPKLSTAAINARERLQDVRDRANDVSDAVKAIPSVKPKVELVGASGVYDWATRIGVKLDGVGGKRPKPAISVAGGAAAEGLATRLERALDRIDGKHATASVKLTTDTTGTFSVNHLEMNFRAKGGPVRAGQPYMVGEREPELFVPRTNGRILNQQQMAAAGVGAGSPLIGEYHYHAHEAGQMPEQSMARAMSNLTFLLGS
jgi:TP901 family phage tail tape measure protein